MPSWLYGLWQASLQAIFPPRCLICGAFGYLQHSAENVKSDRLAQLTAGYFCESCRKGVTAVSSPFCTRCGLPFVSREGEDHTCSECILEKRHFRIARAFGVYNGSLMEAMHLFKYAKKASLSKPLGLLTRETFFRFWDNDSVDLVVPVPLHVKRLRERGFNQAHLLIRRWAKEEGISFDGLALFRSRWTEPQTTLSRAERQKNIKGAFSVVSPQNIKGKRILLVDDVYTTGSTVNECAKVLAKADAEFVDVLTLARAV